MLHSTTEKFEQTVKGVELKITLKAPEGAVVKPILEEIQKLMTYAATDPNQLGLGLEEPE